jgi:hypothetical protein
MRTFAVVPVPFGALIMGWAVGWSLGVLILVAAALSLGFGMVFWWCWDALLFRWQERNSLAQYRVPAYAEDRHEFS